MALMSKLRLFYWHQDRLSSMQVRKRQVLLICDFGPGLPDQLLSLYEKMRDTSITLVRRKYGSVGPTSFQVIQIPPAITSRSLGKSISLEKAFNASCYILVGSVVSVLAALRFRCTIVHSRFLVPEGLVGLITSLFSRAALVSTAEGSDVNIYTRNPFVRAIIRMIAMRGTIVSVSKPIQAKLFLMGVDSVYIPNFVDGKKFSFVPTEQKEDTLLFVGMLIELKKPDLLIDAVAKASRQHLPEDLRIQIVGSGPLESSIRKSVREQGLEDMTSFEGNVPNEVVRDLMARALIYVSTSEMEGTSFALIEAMASGCVVIASDIPGNSAIIRDHENGLLFRQGDPVALGAAIEEAFNDRALCQRLAKNARQTFESYFDVEKSAYRLSEIYAKAEKRNRDT